MPPPLHDPTGGLLKPALGPINYIIGAMQDAILASIRDEIFLLKMGLTDGTMLINDYVDDAFKTVFKDAQAMVQQATNTIKSVLSMDNGVLDDATALLGNIEDMVGSIALTIGQMAMSISNVLTHGARDVVGAIDDILNDTRNNIGRALEQNISSLTKDVMSSSNALTADIDSYIITVNNACASAISTAKSGLRQAMSTISVDIKNATGEMKTLVNDGTSRTRAARNRLASVSTNNILQTIDVSGVKSDLEYVKNKSSEALGSLNMLGTITTIIILVMVVVALIATYRIYHMFFKSILRGDL